MAQYYAVIYTKPEYGSTIHLKPGDTQEECLEILRKVRDDSKWGRRIAATTVIKRDMDNFKEGMIFGSPKSLNVITERRK